MTHYKNRWDGHIDDMARVEPDKHGIRVLSIDHHQVPAQAELKRARTQILSYFKDTFPEIEIKTSTISLNAEGDFFSESMPFGSVQPLLWLGAVMSYLYKDEPLYMGYVGGDDFWIHQADFVEAHRRLNIISGRYGPVRFPLAHMRKHDLIKELRREEALYKLCWYCETQDQTTGLGAPQILTEPCGGCNPCLTHLTAIRRLELIDEADKKRDKATTRTNDDLTNPCGKQWRSLDPGALPSTLATELAEPSEAIDRTILWPITDGRVIDGTMTYRQLREGAD